MSTLPTTTSAWRLHTRGSLATNLRLDKDVPLPALQPGQALVAIEEAALNPVDWKLAILIPSLFQKLPRTLGADFIARVLEVAPPAASSPPASFLPTVGQRVHGMIPPGNFRVGQGSLSKYAVIPFDKMTSLPPAYPERASGAALVGLTALRLANNAKKGDRVLLLGASTSVGVLTADMIKSPLIGVSHVVGTASGDKIDLLKQRGKIDEFVDYRTETDLETTFAQRYGVNSPQAFDLILDCVGSTQTQRRCGEFLKPDGIYFNIGASDINAKAPMTSVLHLLFGGIKAAVLPTFLGGNSRKILQGGLQSRREDWDQLNKFIEGGHLHPIIDSTWSFQDVPKAYEKLMTGRAMGKLIVKVEEDVKP